MSVRKFKFRAWDKREKRMGEVTEIRFSKSQYPCVNVRFKQNGKIIDERYCFGQEDGCDNVILMQYTGLKDKNGKEIYEGDIVKLCDTNPILFRVETILARYGYKTVFKLLDDGTIAQCYFLDKCEVVGNIHDNPELLKEVESV